MDIHSKLLGFTADLNDIQHKIENFERSQEAIYYANKDSREISDEQKADEIERIIRNEKNSYFYLEYNNLYESITEDYKEDFAKKLALALKEERNDDVCKILKEHSLQYWRKYLDNLID
jgi:hypothetical protein